MACRTLGLGFRLDSWMNIAFLDYIKLACGGVSIVVFLCGALNIALLLKVQANSALQGHEQNSILAVSLARVGA